MAVNQASALEADYGLGYGAVYSDNIGLSNGAEQSEWINMFRGLFSLQERSTMLDTRLYSLLEFRQYTQTDYDDELLFALDGRSVWTISPQRLTFTVEDRFTQVPVTPDVAVGPTNRQDANVFSAGPNLTLHLSRIDLVELGGRYSHYYYETAGSDSNRYSGFARLSHALSPLTRVSVNYEPSFVDFENETLNPDYTRQDVFLGGRTNRLGLDIFTDFGKTFIDRNSGNARDVEGTLIRGGLTRQMTSDSSLTLMASDQYSEAGRDTLTVNPVVVGSQSPSAILPTDFVAGGLYAAQQIDLAYSRRRYYGTNTLSAFWRELDFESPQILLDHQVSGVHADFGIDYSAAFTNSFFGNYSETEYLKVARNDKDYGIGARFVYRFLRTLSLSTEARWSRRDSTFAPVSYDELRGVVTIAYNTNYALTVGNPFIEQNNPLYR